MKELELPLNEIQNIANVIDMVKKENQKELGMQPVYWLGRLRDLCTPILTRINEDENELIKKHTIQKNEDGSRKINTEEYSLERKKFLTETKETIKFPTFKASQFINKEKSLVPAEFWQVFSKYIEIDVDWMKE